MSDLITIADAAAYAKTSKKTISRQFARGMKHLRDKRVVRTKIEWIDEFMGKQSPQVIDETQTPAMRNRIRNYEKAMKKLGI
jgi:hypothetical protein